MKKSPPKKASAEKVVKDIRRQTRRHFSAEDIQDQIVEMALEQSELSPREPAVRFTDERQYFVSEATVYHLMVRR